MAAGDKWQYQVITQKARGFVRQQIDPDETARLLNEQGTRGWELVGATPIVSYNSTHSISLIFKRPG